MDNKSQAAPFLIAVLIIILMMSMVAINVAKTGFLRTDVSNAVDAGALAGGSSMAYYFNEQCYLNGIALNDYNAFVDLVDVYINGGYYGGYYGGNYYGNGNSGYIEGILPLLLEAEDACSSSDCDTCKSKAQQAYDLTQELQGNEPNDPPPPVNGNWDYVPAEGVIPKYQWKQWRLYNEMKLKSMVGRHWSMRLALRFAFLNSGIGPKLPGGSPDSRRFKSFLSDTIKSEDPISAGCSLYMGNLEAGNMSEWQADTDRNLLYHGSPSCEVPFEWQDGANRNHNVQVKVDTGQVNKYKVQVTHSKRGELNTILTNVLDEIDTIKKACASCPDISDIDDLYMKVTIELEDDLLADGIKDLRLENQASDPVEDDGFGKEIVAYVKDIEHDRKFKADSVQFHEGGTYQGLIGTSYPSPMGGSCSVDFKDEGIISDPANGNMPVGKFRPFIEDAK